MDASTIALVTFGVYFILHFFVTQALYDSKYFYFLIALIIATPFFVYFYHLNGYTSERLHKSVFMISYYGIVLLDIKLIYKRLNRYLIHINWVKSEYTDKDYTFVTRASKSGNPVWDRESANPPSGLDFFCSYALLFLPMIGILLTL